MARSTSPWDQPDDPRDHTVDLPRMDVDALTDYFQGTASLPEQQPSGQLEPLPEREPAGMFEPLPDQDPRPAPSSPDELEPRSHSLPPVSSRPGGLRHPYAEPLVTDRRLPTTPASEPAAPDHAVSDRSAAAPALAGPAPPPVAPDRAASAPASVAPAPAAPAPAAAMFSDHSRAPGAVAAPPQTGSRTPPRVAERSAEFSRTSRAPAGSLADLRSRLARLPDGHPSSPYEDDGRARPLPVRLKQLELGLPAPGRDFAGGFAADVDDANVEPDQRPRPPEPELGEPAGRPRAESVPEIDAANPDAPPKLPVDAGEVEAPDLVAADEPAADPASALAASSGSTSRPAAHDEPTPFPQKNASGHPARRELTDPYADEGIGRATPVRADLTVRRWQSSPSPRPSGAESFGSNGHDIENGNGKLAQERPAGDGRRDTAEHRIAHPPTGDLRDLVERTLAGGRVAEGRNVVGSYGASGLTPALRRLAAHLPFGGLAPDSEVNSLKTAERLTAKLTRLIARNPGRTPEELAAGIGDVVRYAFAFEAADYAEGTWLVHRRLKSHGFELEIRRNRWESPEYKGIFTQWRDPAHDAAFEVQFHTTASWSVVRQTHPAYVQITDPATAPADRARLRAQQVAAAATAKSPPNWAEIGDFRLEAR